MRLTAIRELKSNPAKVIREAKAGDVVVTSRGRPVAIMKAISPEELEDYLLVNYADFKELMREADREFLNFLREKKVRVKTADKLLKEAKKELGSPKSYISTRG